VTMKDEARALGISYRTYLSRKQRGLDLTAPVVRRKTSEPPIDWVVIPHQPHPWHRLMARMAVR
jgi:hypothetical protein